jgi:hypothetical protein
MSGDSPPIATDHPCFCFLMFAFIVVTGQFHDAGERVVLDTTIG